jgi:hypothetical protein
MQKASRHLRPREGGREGGRGTYHAGHLQNVLVAHPVVVGVRVPGDGGAGGVRLHDPHFLLQLGVGLVQIPV